MRSILTFAAVLLVAAAGARPALANDRQYVGPIHEIYRDGFLIGFSIGAGGLGPDPCRDCGVGFAADFHLGAMASREVAVLLEGDVVTRGDVTHALVGAAAQWWPDPAGRFWVKGGLGIGSLNHDNGAVFVDDPFDARNNDYVYPSVFGGGGVEVVRSDRFTIDVQLKGAATRQRGHWGHSVSVNVGLNWY
jgi:hypothetical protein